MFSGAIPCVECGSPVSPGSNVCPNCGTAVAGHSSEVLPVSSEEVAEDSTPNAGSARAATAEPTVPAVELAAIEASEVPSASQALEPPPVPPVVVAPASVPTLGRAPLLADLPGEAPTTLAGWLVVAGSWIGAMSFLLPWAPGIADYTSSWGLATLANLPILAFLIATTVLAILPNRIPTWIRSGLFGLVGGSLFLGILWPYVVGDFGSAFGSLVGAAASLVLIAGGVLAVAPRPETAAT